MISGVISKPSGISIESWEMSINCGIGIFSFTRLDAIGVINGRWPSSMQETCGRILLPAPFPTYRRTRFRKFDTRPKKITARARNAGKEAKWTRRAKRAKKGHFCPSCPVSFPVELPQQYVRETPGTGRKNLSEPRLTRNRRRRDKFLGYRDH